MCLEAESTRVPVELARLCAILYIPGRQRMHLHRHHRAALKYTFNTAHTPFVTTSPDHCLHKREPLGDSCKRAQAVHQQAISNRSNLRETDMLWIIKKLFDDKRYTVGLLLGWMLAVCTIFYFLGAFHMNYMHIGKNPECMENIQSDPRSKMSLTHPTFSCKKVLERILCSWDSRSTT